MFAGFAFQPPPVHPLVIDWVRRVSVNGGGTAGHNSIQGHNAAINLIQSSNSLSSSLKSLCLFPSDNAIASSTPLLLWSGAVDPWTNTNFNGNDLTKDGLKGDGSGKFLSTGIKPGSQMTNASSFGFVVVSEDDTTSGQTEFGITDEAGTNSYRMYYHYSDKRTYITCYGDFTNMVITSGSLTGYVAASRTSTTQLDLYRANNATPHTNWLSRTTAEANTPSTTRPMAIFATREVDTVTNFTKKRICAAGFGLGISAKDSTLLYSAVVAARTWIGGGIT